MTFRTPRSEADWTIQCPACGHVLAAIQGPPTEQRWQMAGPSPDTQGETVPLLVRVSDAAELLQISRTKLYDLIGRGEVPAVRIGGSVRISRRELERMAGWH